MRNVLLIAKLTVLLAYRSGTLIGAVLLPAALATAIFWSATGDENLVNELQVRLHYAYTLAYAVAMLLVIVVAALVIRSPIDEQQLHLLDTRPISRTQTWLGKWVGMIVLAAFVQLGLMASLGLSTWWFADGYDAGQRGAAARHYFTAEAEHLPVPTDFPALARERVDQLIRDGKLQADAVTDEVWQANLDQVRREAKAIGRGQVMTRSFDLGGKPQSGDTVRLRLRFYSTDEALKQELPFRLELKSATSIESWATNFRCFAYEYYDLEIPRSAIPGDGRFELLLQNRSPYGLVVPTGTGMRLYAEDCSLTANLIRVAALQIFHLAVVAAVGLVTGVAFTFPVAAFCSLVAYLLAVFAGVFSEVVTAIQGEFSTSWLEQVGLLVLHVGKWLVQGLTQPQVIEPLSTGLAVPVGALFGGWLPAAIVYAAIAATLGCWLLTRKELDRLH